MITFRLADSLPPAALAQKEQPVGGRADADMQLRRRVQAYLDAGYGACFLRQARIARLIEQSLLHSDGPKYRLLAWTIMPNHVHVVMETVVGHTLSTIIKAWKSFTAHKANKLLGRTGAFWHPDYFDRVICDERHLEAAIRYVEQNPVKAGLVDQAEDWGFGSASRIWPNRGRTRRPRSQEDE
jgi:REP element-mobilizing transposase RayT